MVSTATEEEPNIFKPPDSYVPEMLPRLECQQSLYPRESAIVMQPRLEYQTCHTFYAPQIATVEEPTMVKHIGSYVPEMQPRLEYQAGQTLYPPHATLSQIPNDPFINLPPSFTTLLSGCFPNSSLGNLHNWSYLFYFKIYIASFIHFINKFSSHENGYRCRPNNCKAGSWS